MLGNTIDFKKGGGLSVVGELIPDEALPLRTNFQFKSASIDFGFAKFDIPPVGEGWFDTVYLDEVIRIDTNSRDDILICTPKAWYTHKDDIRLYRDGIIRIPVTM